MTGVVASWEISRGGSRTDGNTSVAVLLVFGGAVGNVLGEAVGGEIRLLPVPLILSRFM
jgi:lipoprotein signal peptidase